MIKFTVFSCTFYIRSSDWFSLFRGQVWNLFTYKHFLFSSVLIQGRYGNGLGQEFAEFFAFEYRSSIDQQYIRYTDQKGISVLPANINTFQVNLLDLLAALAGLVIWVPPLTHARISTRSASARRQEGNRFESHPDFATNQDFVFTN